MGLVAFPHDHDNGGLGENPAVERVAAVYARQGPDTDGRQQEIETEFLLVSSVK